MQNFLSKIVTGAGITPPEVCNKSFIDNFQDSINIEWFDRGEQFEAVFYKNNLEHTARFGKSGNLIEYRMVLPEGYLPLKVRAYLESKGEIMNRVLINKGNSIVYETIIRNKDLHRFQIELTELGEVISESKL